MPSERVIVMKSVKVDHEHEHGHELRESGWVSEWSLTEPDLAGLFAEH